MADVADLRQLAGLAAERAAGAERDRRLSDALVHALAEAGLYRLCVPRAVGGEEAHPAQLVEAVETLAAGDAAAGWCVAISATSGLLAAYLPEESAREVYADPLAIAGGVFAPRGRAVPEDGGFRVTGRWPFASGCEHCDWLMGGCVVADGEGVRTLPNGMPDVRLMLAPAAEFTIHDTWQVAGLRGTGSHDIELGGVHVAAERGASVISDAPLHDGPLYAFPLFGLLALAIAGVSLGIARGALDDLVALAAGKVPTGGTRALGRRGAVQAEVAQAEAALRAARALLYGTIDDAWGEAAAGGEVGVPARTALRLAATHAASTAADVARAAYTLGGGTALYEASPLQRRFRDAHAATQHMLVAPSTWELTGRLLLGQPTDTTQL